jgi:long-chain acyl-CoA synthetase
MPAETRRELHYGSRIVRCFAERPAHVDAMLRAAVARHPDADALVLGEIRVSYRRLDGIVERVAGNLAARGFAKGDRLALLLGNCLEFVYLVLAAARLGVITVPMNPRQRRPEIEYMLTHCATKGLAFEAEQAEQIPPAAAVPSVERLFVVGGAALDAEAFDALDAPSAPVPPCPVAEEDTFCILYTSGTTGRPKGAMLTHLGTLHSVLHYETGLALGADEVALLAVPASHVTGLVAIILAMIRTGGRTVFMPAFKARDFLALAARERMTYTLIVPAMYNLCLLLPEFGGFDLSSWRLGGFGGAPMPLATIARLAAQLPRLVLVNVYGATETTGPTTILPLGEAALHPDTVGRPARCAEVMVVDEEGREVAPGASGEVWIAGPMVVPGYWNNPEATAGSFVGGYWRSGDVGSIDANGYVRIFDRKKDMINRGGYKVYCIEVENVLGHHPSVIECAVVGRPDEVLGERVHAFVCSRDGQAGPAALRAFCAERLSDYKVPESFTFLTDALPRNAAGKVLKPVLRERVLAAAKNGSIPE